MDNSQSSSSADMAQFTTVDPQDLSNDFSFHYSVGSPTARNGKARMPVITSSIASPTSAISQDLSDDQRMMMPSHDYGRFKQQTGLPTQAFMSQQNVMSGFNTGIYENNWESMGGQMDPRFEAFLSDMANSNDDLIDPTAIMKQEQDQANIRYFPGMHSAAQQAMLAKQKRQAELQQQQQRAQPARRSASSQPLDARTEETISRVMNEIRRKSDLAADTLSPSNNNALPHIIRARKDEEEMDEDEKLLNSEEGKKLSSKERRQLRNKVSARAFRSRRKEYIGQLEGEVAAKVNEAAELKRQNIMLMEENARFRSLAEKLLAHPAFYPFLDELSRDPDLAESLSKVSGPSVQPQAQIPKDIDPFAQSHMLPAHNPTTHVGMTMIPEMPVDLSSLNIGTSQNWNVPQMGFNTQVFAVTELPTGPAEPLDFEALVGKTSEDVQDVEQVDQDKPLVPVIESACPKVETSVLEESPDVFVPANDIDDNDPAFALFAASPAKSPVPAEPVTESAASESEAVEMSEEQIEQQAKELARFIARLEATSKRIGDLLDC